MIGTSLPRPDGAAKVAGALQYGDDSTLPGMWYGATVRSPHPHAGIEAVGWQDGAPPAGVVCLTAADRAVRNAVKLRDDSWPGLAYTPLQGVADMEAAAHQPPLYTLDSRSGNIDADMAAADRIVESSYRRALRAARPEPGPRGRIVRFERVS
jgi:hypothetical protein